MKNHIPVDIPTKTYIKAYIMYKLGEKPVLSQQSIIGHKLYDLLQHQLNERKAEYTNSRYKCIIRVYINRHIFRTRGANLNETNVKNFNSFVENLIKHRYYELMDHYIDVLPNFEANLPAVRKKLGIDIEAWADDSMKKDYYRYRLENKLPLLYKKNSSRLVPSMHDPGNAF